MIIVFKDEKTRFTYYSFPTLEGLSPQLTMTSLQAFKWALLFLFFLLFPTFLICSYFSLLFNENALLSLLFHSKMSFTRKNQGIFPRSLGFRKFTSKFIQRARRLTPQNLMFNLKSLCLPSIIVTGIILLI